MGISCHKKYNMSQFFKAFVPNSDSTSSSQIEMFGMQLNSQGNPVWVCASVLLITWGDPTERGAFHSEKSVRDFSDFKNPRIFNGFPPDFSDFLRIFRDKNPQNFHDFPPTFEHFRSDIFLDYFPNKNHLLSFTVFNVNLNLT